MKRCKKCGAKLPDSANFCNICGAPAEEETVKLNKNSAAEKTAPEQTQETVITTTENGNGNENQYQPNAADGVCLKKDPQTVNREQYNSETQVPNGEQFNSGAQYNSQQFQQAAGRETSSAYYGKQQYIPQPTDAKANKGVAICAYIGILWLVPLITAKHSPFAKFHTNQAILVFITNVVLNVAAGIFTSLLLFVSWRFYVIAKLIRFAAGIFSLALVILGIVFAAQETMQEIPLLGQFHIIK